MEEHEVELQTELETESVSTTDTSEVDERILATAEALREDLRSRTIEKRKSFGKGIALGAMLSLTVCLLVFFVVPMQILRQKTNVSGTTASVGNQVADNQTVDLDTQLQKAQVESKLNQLTAFIKENYYEDIDDEQLINGLYKGLFEGIGDIYSAYYTPEEYKDLMVSATSSLSGIGALLQQDPSTRSVSIVRVYDKSPAHKAGLLAGDVIVKADDYYATSMELSEFVTHVRGEKGTKVALKIYRAGEGKYLDYDVVRDDFAVPTVEHQMLEAGIGYVLITEFGKETDAEFAEAVADLETQQMKSLIVDVRSNPGGMIDSVTKILDQILPEGILVWTEDKKGNKKEFKSDAACMKYPMVVLINGNSASSSEIFAGAIRDYEYGTLIGTNTFGKGIVQSIRELKDGSAIKLTIARYFTPKGENIHGTGIAPDIELEYEFLDKDAKEYDIKYDNQVQKAIEVLKDK